MTGVKPSLFEQLNLFRAPRGPRTAERSIALGTRIIHYRLTRSRRRSIGMTIDQRGLRVGAPPAAPLVDIERFILDNAAWVLGKLDEWQHDAKRFVIADGAKLPILGAPWTLRLASGNARLDWIEESREMVFSLRANADPKSTLSRLLREHALDVFLERAVRFAPRLKQDLPSITLSNAQTRWGSCSSKSGVRLNWRLIHLPYPQIDYVIAHEFAHLEHMNHSPRFWAEVERLYPDYPAARAGLTQLARHIPRI